MELERFFRLSDIVGDRRKGKPALIPISKTSWWAGVQDGRYPQPVKLSARTTAWKEHDIRALIERLSRGESNAPKK